MDDSPKTSKLSSRAYSNSDNFNSNVQTPRKKNIILTKKSRSLDFQLDYNVIYKIFESLTSNKNNLIKTYNFSLNWEKRLPLDKKTQHLKYVTLTPDEFFKFGDDFASTDNNLSEHIKTTNDRSRKQFKSLPCFENIRTRKSNDLTKFHKILATTSSQTKFKYPKSHNISKFPKIGEYHYFEGDWLCRKCLNINFSFRFFCNCCSQTKETTDRINILEKLRNRFSYDKYYK